MATLINPQAIDRLTWWRRLATLLICTGAFYMLAHLVVVKYHDLPTLGLFAIGTVLWVVAASYETQYLFRTRAFQFKVAYWQGYCPYCDHFHEDYQFAFEPRPYEFYKLVICKCERDLVVKTDIDGYHHLA